MTNVPGVLAYIKVTVALTLVLATAALTALFCLFPQHKDQLTFFSATAGGAAALYCGYYAAITLTSTTQRDRMKSTFEMLDALNNIDMAEIRFFIGQQIDAKQLSPDKIFRMIEGDPEKARLINRLLGILEDVSIAIQCGYIDEQIVYDSLSYIVVKHFGRLRPYVTGLQQHIGDTTVYCEVTKLADAWGQKNSVRPGGRIAAP